MKTEEMPTPPKEFEKTRKRKETIRITKNLKKVGNFMKVKKIHIDNILSYDNETIELNNDLNIIVGANGSGKSNLMNIIIYIY